ncbi:leucyl aminopeptidase family protein [Dyella sp.]|uniref:leucyl aminopeptidase family protein n=1 Tax=Dyella sp. TaxID=1869338 RepID=UPI002D7A0F30|nr:leucyl aminopeptidase family protein [Dyella sp.]HET7333151.1 leucyl aminopeptidase family protein [Dyella sp.]
MSALITQRSNRRAPTPIEATDAVHLSTTRKRLNAAQRSWLEENGFDAKPGSVCLVPDANGKLARVLVGVDRQDPLAALAGLPLSLPTGEYALAAESVPLNAELAALGWALGCYQYTRYRKARRPGSPLVVSEEIRDTLTPQIEAIYFVRDLVNMPTEELGPKQLSDQIKALGKTYKAKVREWVGDELLEDNFPTIHMVGRASHRPPRLVELTWGKATDPKLVLVGKGVCFDTGGLDLKPSDGMRWMKKDMGGAAHAIALACLVMEAKLPVRLTLLVPAVENAVSGAAMRPGDVVVTRGGHSVEIDNTDAEGRLVLCDALAYAAEQKPELIIDFATLTGAARVALGPDVPALFANDDALAEAALMCSQAVADPVWRLPLWRPYRKLLESYIADFANAGASRHAGAITAALFMERFIPEGMPWLHLDTYAWTDGDRPGRPRGGEAMGLRAMFALLGKRYG